MKKCRAILLSTVLILSIFTTNIEIDAREFENEIVVKSMEQKEVKCEII